MIAHDEGAIGMHRDLEELAGSRGEASFELRSGETLRRVPEGVDAVVLSPGVPRKRPLIQDALDRGVEVLAEVELAYRALGDDFGALIAITGSNGKSTTTALTGHLLAAAGHRVEVCGNIGVPMCDRVDGDPGRVFVLELSSFQLESVDSFRPDVSVLLNVAPDHLDRYDGLEEYRRAKERIFQRQGDGDLAVLNAADPPRAELPAVRRRNFSLEQEVEDGCYLAADRVLEVGEGTPTELFRVSSVPLVGQHNLENAMAAVLTARSLALVPGLEAFRCEASELSSALASFRGLPHRMQRVIEYAGVSWIDDSKGTNVAATERALEGFEDGTVHLILGGRSKDTEIAELRSAVESKVRCLYLIGEAAPEFERVLGSVAPTRMAETLERAVQWAASAAQPGDVVLLSPACASFDQFRDFVDRGETFQQLVHALRVSYGEGQHG